MKNTIAARIADFLKSYPPFSLLNEDQLLSVSGEVKVIYLEKGKAVFRQGEKGHNLFYVVNKGAIALEKKNNSEVEAIDKCDEGDIFGLRPLFARENYLINARAEEESIIYGISIENFKPIIEGNFKVADFLMQSFASNTRNPYSSENKGQLVSTIDQSIRQSSTNLFELQPAPITRKVVKVAPATPIQKVAALMSEKRTTAVLVVENEIPQGIITSEVFRDLIAGGNFDTQSSASQIMSSPVICYPKSITIAQAQITMMKHRIRHICITIDGTPNTKVIGILSEHNILVSEGHNPSILMRAIKNSDSTKELKKIRNKVTLLLKGYLDNNIPLTHISKIIFELNDATIKRIIERCIKKIASPPPVNFAWLSLGSQGRKEQLLQTDQDNAIIFEDVPAEKLEETRNYFLELARKVNKRLSIIGYEYCPVDTMARNPNWCRSLSEWKEHSAKWINRSGNDELLLSSIFFDYDISYGDVRLSNTLSDHIFENIRDNKRFISFMGATALKNPSPVGFFRQFLVEQNGENKNTFDIKKRAITPITDAGRLLILHHQVKNISNTAERFEKLAQLEPNNKELFLSCSYTSKALLKFRTRQGLIHRDSGRYIQLANLTKEEKMKLKRCFKTIRDVQELIKYRFGISNYM
jgi:CBS domain-containing protein